MPIGNGFVPGNPVGWALTKGDAPAPLKNGEGAPVCIAVICWPNGLKAPNELAKKTSVSACIQLMRPFSLVDLELRCTWFGFFLY